MRMLPFILCLALLGGCATTGSLVNRDPRDPMENFNRGVWNFNQDLDKAAIKPATGVYRAVTPVPARRGLSRLLANLGEPLNAINALLQGKPKRAFNSLGRFVVNTTIGVGGLADHASELGLPPTPEDFGQTLAVWGVKSSSYLVLPVLGPSTVRDGIGTAAELSVNPPGLLLKEAGASRGIRYGATAVRVLQSRSEAIDSGVDALLETSADPYAAARDAYFQRREAEIADREGGPTTTEEQDQLLNNALEENQPDADSAAPEAAPSVPAPPPVPQVEQPKQPAATTAEPKLSMLLVDDDETIAY